MVTKALRNKSSEDTSSPKRCLILCSASIILQPSWEPICQDSGDVIGALRANLSVSKCIYGFSLPARISTILILYIANAILMVAIFCLQLNPSLEQHAYLCAYYGWNRKDQWLHHSSLWTYLMRSIVGQLVLHACDIFKSFGKIRCYISVLFWRILCAV